jgi:hypothetical protein
VAAIHAIEQLCTDAPFFDGSGRKVVVADDVMAIISALPQAYRAREWWPCSAKSPVADMHCTRPDGHIGLHSHTGHYWDEPIRSAS